MRCRAPRARSGDDARRYPRSGPNAEARHGLTQRDLPPPQAQPLRPLARTRMAASAAIERDRWSASRRACWLASCHHLGVREASRGPWTDGSGEAPQSCFVAATSTSPTPASGPQCAARATQRPAPFADSWLAAEPRCARFPRLAGLGSPAGSDLLPKFAGLRVGPATGGGACPAFMRTRSSGPTVLTTDGPMTLRVSRMANLRFRAIAAKRPLAA
jgi:hypothetical protein